MNKNLILAFALFSLPVFAEEDLGPGKYVCDIRISSTDTATQILSKSATVLDNGNNFIVQMPNGDQLYSPDLENVDDGIKQKATIGGVTFIRRQLLTIASSWKMEIQDSSIRCETARRNKGSLIAISS